MPWRTQTLVVLLPGQGRLCVTGQGHSELARTGIVHQGHGVDHAHTTLFPCTAPQVTKARNRREVTPTVESVIEGRLQLAAKIDRSVSYRPVMPPEEATWWARHARGGGGATPRTPSQEPNSTSWSAGSGACFHKPT